MKEKKKNTNLMENQKRLFLRMKSPSAFGAARRFDSASSMNVPPEMARRDAAYSFFFDFFLHCDLRGKSAAERNSVYHEILRQLDLIEEKTEFILNADIAEKRNIEPPGNLALVHLLQKYFSVLANLSAIQAESVSADSVVGSCHFPLDKFPSNEELLADSVRYLLKDTYPLLLAGKEQLSKCFSKSDSERYERAYSFYSDYYRKQLNPQPNE